MSESVLRARHCVPPLTVMQGGPCAFMTECASLTVEGLA
jgi:hypothetical protein